jgi:hypothetical protein
VPASRLQWGRLPLNRASGPLVLATGGLAFCGPMWGDRTRSPSCAGGWVESEPSRRERVGMGLPLCSLRRWEGLRRIPSRRSASVRVQGSAVALARLGRANPGCGCYPWGRCTVMTRGASEGSQAGARGGLGASPQGVKRQLARLRAREIEIIQGLIYGLEPNGLVTLQKCLEIFVGQAFSLDRGASLIPSPSASLIPSRARVLSQPPASLIPSPRV